MDNFRYGNFGPDELDGPLFYSDLMRCMSQRRLNPAISILISCENDVDYSATQFWADQRVVQLLTRAQAKVIRIRSGAQATAYQQFNELYPVRNLPSLFVFGPSSSGPSFVYSSQFPTFDVFLRDFSSLVYTPPPAPFTQPTGGASFPEAEADEPVRHRIPKNPSPQPDQQPQAQAPPPKPKSPPPKPKPQPAQAPVAPKPTIPIKVTAETPDKKSYTQMFNSTDNCIHVRIWISKIVGRPHNQYNLKVMPADYQLPLSDKVFLAQYAPELNLKVIFPDTPVTPNDNRRGIFGRFLDFLSDFSIFADKEDDPGDFWRTEPVFRRSDAERRDQRNGTHPIPRQNARNQNQQQNQQQQQQQQQNQQQQNQHQRQEGNVRRFRFDDGRNEEGYANGNDTQFGQ